jgi:hypothetical protein
MPVHSGKHAVLTSPAPKSPLFAVLRFAQTLLAVLRFAQTLLAVLRFAQTLLAVLRFAQTVRDITCASQDTQRH